MSLLLLPGCGGGARKAATEGKGKGKEEEKATPRLANVESGSSSHYSPLPNRKRLWSIRWKTARISFVGKTDFGGSMETVSGSIFKEGAEASRFSARHGEGDRRQNRLVLTGRVRLDALDPDVTILCDKVEWLADRELVRATGNVRAEGPWGTLSPMPEMWATPDLRRVGTPEAFRALGGSG